VTGREGLRPTAAELLTRLRAHVDGVVGAAPGGPPPRGGSLRNVLAQADLRHTSGTFRELVAEFLEDRGTATAVRRHPDYGVVLRQVAERHCG
jgi:hypothetical protein